MPDKQRASEIWVIAEPGVSGGLADSTFELLSKASALAAERKASVGAVVYGPGAKELPSLFEGWGVSKLYAIDKPELSGFHEEPLAQAIADAARKYEPDTILGPATVRGRSLLPRIAALLGAGLTADCTGLEIDAETGRLLQTRPAFGGNLLATIVSEAFPQMATVRPHVFHKVKPEGASGLPSVVDLSSGFTKTMKRILKSEPLAAGANLSDAKVIVSVGMGVGGAKGIKLAQQLAKKLNASLAASRSVVDSGLLSYSHQVGQTGVTVHPDIYIACGISGAIQHLVGMQGSGYIVAINRDPEAPIMTVSDVALCGDAQEILTMLLLHL